MVVQTDTRIVGLVLLLSLLPIASVCSAQSNDNEQAWLPPSWVMGSGYAPYDYLGGAMAYGYDPFFYNGLTGHTYNPYGDIFSYYGYQGKTYNPYPYYYGYPQSYWYPQSYGYPYGYYNYYGY